MELSAIQCLHSSYYESLNPHLNTVGFHHAQPGDSSRLVFRILEDFGLWYVRSGAGRVMLDQTWVGFRRNDVLVLKPGELYQREELIDPASEYTVFYLRFFPFGHSHMDLDACLASELPRKLTGVAGSDVGEYFRELYELHEQRPDGYELQSKVCILTILGRLLVRLHAEKGVARSPTCLPRLLQAVDFLRAHFAENIHLADIAREAGLSSSHLSSVFKKYLHHSPIDFLIELRLAEAKRRMWDGCSVSDAADQTGFHTVHYFSRIFRSRYGLSPLKYIRLCGGSIANDPLMRIGGEYDEA